MMKYICNIWKLCFLLGCMYPITVAVESNTCSVKTISTLTYINCVDIRLTGELPLSSKVPDTSTVVSLQLANSSGKIDETSFTNINHIQTIDIEHCALSKFVLPILPELKVLDISDSFIPSFDRNSLKNCKNLDRIYLKKNRMEISNGAFQDLIHLTILDIEQQNVTLNEQFLKGLKNLTLLSITDSTITTISKDIFKDVPELADLNLSRNPLEKIEIGALDPLKKLTQLNILDTDLNKLDAEIFKGNSILESLRAPAKAIKNFDLRKFMKNSPGFYIFDFSLTDCGNSAIHDLQSKIKDDEFVYVYFDGIERPDRC
ncbi:toll-like receptor 7 isoform X1 [Diorhabda carinulata]|uniref:toll-like receptor 7 isoform X1 n=2 Tax=Diorhabda carinulata TaxID=1163345 RepID=UPI0025A23D7D|nr:toll-like receptor 7 isoform X1 [Diorhabda carinulata]